MSTPIPQRTPNYSDLDLDFIPHPTTGDVVRKVGEDAIKRSIRNLVLTNFYDRPFRPWIGCNARKLLFENINPLTATFLQNAILEVIRNYESRGSVLDVIVSMNTDSNGYDARIVFNVINNPQPIIINLFLEKIRG
jgi:phage baseplate assembly protein W